MVEEWIAIGISIGAMGISIWALKKSRKTPKQNPEYSSMTLNKLLLNTNIKTWKKDVVFWYWNRKDRNELVHFHNTKYEESARKLEYAFNNAAEIYEQDLINKKIFSEIFGGTLVRFWRILHDDIIHVQESQPNFCKSFHQVAEELMKEYKIIGEPYQTKPRLPEN